MTDEKEQLEDAVHTLAIKIRSELHMINNNVLQIEKDLEDLEDMAIILGRLDEPTIPLKYMKKWLEEIEGEK
jgi:hypothetical protein